MTMVSDRELINLANEFKIVEPFQISNCKGASINLTLGQIVKKYTSEEPIILGKEVTETHYETIDLSDSEFWLMSNQSVLISTFETVSIPNRYAGRIYERFSVKALGLSISPAHYLNPGYRGKVSLYATNNTNVPIKLVPGVQICQLVLFELSSEPLSPYEKQDGKYMDANTVSISKLHLDKYIQDFLKQKGIDKISDDMAKDLGDHLIGHVKKSAKRLADILREEDSNS